MPTASRTRRARARRSARIVDRAIDGQPAGDSLPPDVAEAYVALSEEAELRADGPAGDPGSDREPFDANRAYRNARLSGPHAGSAAPPSFGLPGPLGPALTAAAIVVLEDEGSRRARSASRQGSTLLMTLMEAVPAGRTVAST